ncbi:MAG: hypothetical protein GY842_12595 [bacterium]|nr:hypothetical protein [bacterium]
MIGQTTEPAGLSLRLQAVRDHFAHGGGWTGVLAVLGVLALCVLALAWVQRRREAAQHHEPNDPRKLFRTVLTDLGLSPRQRKTLHRVAADLKLEHPTIMLLSPHLFHEHVAAWTSTHTNPPTDELAAVARRLFQPAGQSAP